MKTNDLKKGARVRLENGWYATIADNLKGTIRMATVEGFETETGSVYAHDISFARVAGVGSRPTWAIIEHTPAQVKLRETIKQMGF